MKIAMMGSGGVGGFFGGRLANVVKDDILRRFFPPAQVMGGVCYVASHIGRPGVIHQTGTMQRIVVDEPDGRETARTRAFEVEWLAGAVVQLGAAKGVATPANRAVWDVLAPHSPGKAGA